MAEIKIPTRPADYDKTAIKKNDADCLTYSVLMGGKNEDAFRLFHPEYLGSDGKLTKEGKEASKQFFMYARNKEYIDAYKEELSGILSKDSVIDVSIDEGRKEKALKALLHQAMSIVEGKGNLDPETLKIATEIFKKIGLLKDDETEMEVPRRYIPIRCRQECQYRLFCEQAIKNGEIENECLYCKALAIAREHGYKYDPTTNLNIPQKEEN